MNETINIYTDEGNIVEAQAPVIISASRATDIPAMHPEWFIERLRKSYAVRINPFNRRAIYVSFQNTRVVVFWSKNPRPLMPCLKEIDERGIGYYFQFTLNDYEREGLEPNLPPLTERIDTFRELSDTVGKEKVIWRFDPLMLTPQTDMHELAGRIQRIGRQLKGYTDKLVFSFIDVKGYRRVRSNLIRKTSLFSADNVECAEPDDEAIDCFARTLTDIKAQWSAEGWNPDLATCAESADLEKYGIQHNRCIDDELMRRIFADDTTLIHFLSYGSIPDERSPKLSFDTPQKPVNLKDKGQRKACRCIVSKDIGSYGDCKHLCAYCYATIR
jgi:DNA repair photolyase